MPGRGDSGAVLAPFAGSAAGGEVSVGGLAVGGALAPFGGSATGVDVGASADFAESMLATTSFFALPPSIRYPT
jgi:hypothetical protein